MHELRTTKEAAEQLRRKPETLRWWRHVGIGPASFKVGGGVVYRQCDIDAWLAHQMAETRRGA